MPRKSTLCSIVRQADAVHSSEPFCMSRRSSFYPRWPQLPRRLRPSADPEADDRIDDHSLVTLVRATIMLRTSSTKCMFAQADFMRSSSTMAFVPGYEHDIFVSYAHRDDEPVVEGRGWVSTFVDQLTQLLKMRLGRADASSIWIRAVSRCAFWLF
jgi:hypothetical protein